MIQGFLSPVRMEHKRFEIKTAESRLHQGLHGRLHLKLYV